MTVVQLWKRGGKLLIKALKHTEDHLFKIFIYFSLKDVITVNIRVYFNTATWSLRSIKESSFCFTRILT
jgi:hypothetical protein